MSERSARRSRRVVLIVAGSLAVVVLAVVGVRLLTAPAPEVPAPDPITTTLALPEPQGDPIAVSQDTELGAAMPEVVFDHVLTAQEELLDAFGQAGAVEGWELTYSAPGSDVSLTVLQWDDADQAQAHAAQTLAEPGTLADGDGRRSGDVAVAGEVVGRYEIGVLQDPPEPTDPSTPAPEEDGAVATPEPLGPGLAVWTNGTVAFIATGDAARLAQFYDHFPY